MSKAKKLVLDVASMEESFFEDALLTGIRFVVDPYQCAGWMNHCLGTKFSLNKEFGVQHVLNAKGVLIPIEKPKFGMYEFDDIKAGIKHYLYVNRNEGAINIRSMRGFNFLWMLKAQDDSIFGYHAMAIKKLQQSNSNVLLSNIDLDEFEDKSYLVF